MSDDSLWHYVALADSTAIVGLKAPGGIRGVYQGRVLLDAEEWRGAKQALAALTGATVLEENERLPNVRVKVRDAQTLAQIRKLPVVDYVEPAKLREGFSFSIGCSYDLASGRTVTYSGIGDIIPWTYKFMGIPEAWKITNGSGKRVGLTDTGIYWSGEQMRQNVRAGQSANRHVTYTHTTNYQDPYIADDGCSHGPRMAGVIAAPRDDSGPVGVAWGAHFVSVRHNDDITVFDTWYAAQAIRKAAENGSDIIVMAWGSPDYWFNSIEDEIHYWHYTHQRLFVGAAGTYSQCIEYIFRNNTFFPAEVPEVIAVTGVNDDGNLPCNVAHGPGVDLAGHIGQATTGRNSEVVSVEGSSNATGVVGGMAALVWSRYPWMSRDQVRQRLESTASRAHHRDGDIGWGIVHAYKAVGGFYNLRTDGPTCLSQYETGNGVSLTAMPYGDGPFTYRWSNGDTNQSTWFPAPAPGETGEYAVYVTDGLEGKTVAAYHRVEVLPADDTRFTCDS